MYIYAPSLCGTVRLVCSSSFLFPPPRQYQRSFDIPKTQQNISSLVNQLATEDEDNLRGIGARHAGDGYPVSRPPSNTSVTNFMSWDYGDEFGHVPSDEVTD